MERQDVLRKITKLLALAGDDCNEHEASRAAIQARKLMAKFDIEMREIEGPGSADKKVEETIGTKQSYHAWEIDLASMMKYFLPVEVLVKANYRGQKRPAFIGHGADVEVVMHMYEYLRKTIWRLGRKMENSRATRSFCVGATQTIYHRLYENHMEEQRKAQQDEKSDEGCYALICVDKQKEIQNYMAETYPDLSYMKKRKTDVDMNAYMQGRLAGKNISLHSQLNGSE